MDRILFVDDDEKILDSYRKIFERKPDSALLESAADFLGEESPRKSDSTAYVGTYCSQGEDAVAEVEQSVKDNNPFKVIFLDMRMPPGIDGSETARRIHEIDSDIEIVIVSAYSDTDIKEFSIETGRPEKILFLRKPFDKKEVIQFALNLVNKYDLNSVKDDFLSHVSHELKTPLSSVLGFAQLLEDDDSIKGESKEFLGLIAENAQLMNQLMEDLFTVVASKRREIRLNLQLCDLKSEVEKIYEMNNSLSGDVDFNIKVDVKRDLKIELDSIRFNQAINSLLSNSFKFTEKGSVTLGLVIDEKGATVSVKDTGVGIPQSKLGTIFEKFNRGGGYNRAPGLGLGLNIFKLIMDKHNFPFKVDSIEGEGTTISISIGESSD